jgi:tetratricopeptide (TPR) repeat protein
MKGTEVGMGIKRSLQRNAWLVALLAIALVSGACNRSPEAKSAKFMAEGKRLMEKKDPARALLQFRNAVQATPRDPEAYFQLGMASLATGDVQQGAVAFRKALELNPKHKEAQLRLSQLMAGTADPDTLKEAQRHLSALLQDTPDNAEALHALALTELKLGDSGDGIQHLEHAMTAAPEGLAFAVTLAQAKWEQGDKKGAEDTLIKACENAPKSADAVAVLGYFYAKQNRLSDAERQYRRAWAMDQTRGTALLDLAMVLNQTGRKQEAEQDFKQVSALPDQTFKSVYATFLFQEGRRDEAIRAFEKLAKEDPEDRVARTQLITAYRTLERLPDAQRVLDSALKKNPKDLDALLQGGEISLDAGKYDQAEADFGQVLHSKPDSPEVHYALGKLYLARGATSRYRDELSNALRINPSLLQIRLELAQTLLADGKSGATAALQLLDSTPPSQKESTSILVKRNWVLWSLKDFAEMRKEIDRGLSRDKSPELLLQDGLWKLQAGNFVAAEAALEQALSIDPADLGALALLNNAYVAQKQSGIAVKKVQEFVARQPKSAPAQELWGMVLMANGDRAQARAAFAAARAMDPHYLKATLSLVQLDILERKWRDADMELKALLANEPGNSTARLWLGEVEVEEGENAMALEQFRKAVASNPNNALALNDLAYLLIQDSKQADEALKYAEKAVELAPEDANYADTLGWVLYQKGLYGPAIKHLERAASTNGNVAWKYHLAMAYAKFGNRASAQTTLNVALKVNPNVPEAKLARELVK